MKTIAALLTLIFSAGLFAEVIPYGKIRFEQDIVLNAGDEIEVNEFCRMSTSKEVVIKAGSLGHLGVYSSNDMEYRHERKSYGKKLITTLSNDFTLIYPAWTTEALNSLNNLFEIHGEYFENKSLGVDPKLMREYKSLQRMNPSSEINIFCNGTFEIEDSFIAKLIHKKKERSFELLYKNKIKDLETIFTTL